MSSSAVVLFSGGQDSTTCLAWAIEKFGKDNLYTLGFDYGQRHEVELECALDIHASFDLPRHHSILGLDVLSQLEGAALTNPEIKVEAVASESSGNKYAHDHGLPSTFVPGRNMLFLTVAAAFAAQKGIYDLVTGVCEADAAGYPDCRRSFIDASQVALSRALDDLILIHTPLVSINKSQTWKMAENLGVLDVIVRQTHTCYNGVHDDDHLHDWGYGCDECPACNERKKGYYEFLEAKSRA